MSDPVQMRKPVRVSVVHNVMQPVSSREDFTWAYHGNGCVRDYIPRHITVTPDTIVRQNGHLIPQDRWGRRGVSPGDIIHIAVAPGDPFSVGTALSIGIPSITAAINVIGGVVISAGVGLGVGYLSSLLVDSPKLPDELDSPTYGAGEIRTTNANGSVIPIVYGEHIVGGTVIGSSTGHVGGAWGRRTNYNASLGGFRSNVVLGLCEGPVQSIGGITTDVTKQWLNDYGQQTVLYSRLSATRAAEIPVRDTSSHQKVAFRFPVRTTNPVVINTVIINMKRYGTLAAGKNISVNFLADTGIPTHVPTGAQILAADVDVNGNSVPTAWHDVTFSLPDPLSLATPATGNYWVEVTGDYDVSPTNYISIASITYGQNIVVNGTPANYNGASWSNEKGKAAIAMVASNPLPYTGTDGAIKINGSGVEGYSANGFISTRRGTADQEALPGASDLLIETEVGQNLPYNQWISQTTQNEVDGVGVVISFPQGWYHMQKNGSRGAASAHFDIHLRANGTEPWTHQLKMKEDSLWFQSPQGLTYRIDFPTEKNNPLSQLRDQIVDVRTKLIFPASPQLPVTWKSLREYSDDQAQTYPHVALLQIDSDVGTAQGPIENITARLEGKKMRTWDGSNHTYEYSANVADCCRDFVLNQRFGLGDKLTTANADEDRFVTWRDYCAEIIPDGNGGTMPRWALGLVIDQEKSGWDWATTIAAAGQCKLIWDGNKIRPKVDKAVTEPDPQIFGAGNSFNGRIQWFGKKKRPNRVNVKYLDADKDFAESVATAVEPSLREDGEPDITETVDLRGVTNRVRALYAAEYYLGLIQYVDWAVELEAHIDSIACEPGDVVPVDACVFETVGGRLKENAPGPNSIKLDRSITIDSTGDPYRITVWGVKTDGTEGFRSRSILESPGTFAAGTVVDITPSWTEGGWTGNPAAGDVYSVMPVRSEPDETNLTGAKLMRVTSVTITNDFFAAVRGVQYDARIYSRVPKDVRTVAAKPELDGKVIPPRPRDLALKVEYYGSSRKLRVLATWNKAAWPYKYDCEIWAREVYPNYREIFGRVGRTSGESFYIENLQEGFAGEVAIVPLAPWTWQGHHPKSIHALRRMIMVERPLNPKRGGKPGGIIF